MSSAPRNSAAATDELPKDITELAQMIAALPANFRGEIEPVLERVVESTRRRRRILTLGPGGVEPVATRHEVPGIRSRSHPSRTRCISPAKRRRG